MVTKNKLRAIARDKADIRKGAEKFFELFKKVQNEPREIVVHDGSEPRPPDDELTKAFMRIPTPVPKRKKKTPENQVVRDCLKLLHMQGIFAWRNNTGAVSIGTRFVRYGHTGSSDIIGLMPCGQFLAVECKAPGGKQSSVQKIFQQKIEANGGRYLLVDSASKLQELL